MLLKLIKLDVLKSDVKKWHFPSIFLNMEQVIEQKRTCNLKRAFFLFNLIFFLMNMCDFYKYKESVTHVIGIYSLLCDHYICMI